MKHPSNARKACDLCYSRKIKCDGQKPRCSHCMIYAADCTYQAPSRTYKPKRQLPQSGEVDGELRRRIQRLEGQLKSVIDQSSARSQDIDIQTLTVDNVSEAFDANTQRALRLELPVFESTLPIINLFLEKFNSIFPLFHAETLLRMISAMYQTVSEKRDPVAWAAVNVVLALSYRFGLVGAENVFRSVDLLNRAQSVISEVVLPQNVQLLNIQVLVGMVMLLQGSQDLRPASILIATTFRLAHSIGLHSRACTAGLSTLEARQYANVFWLAYIADKDLSLRLGQPSIQLDDDIDLDLPGSETLDFSGATFMTRDQVNQHFFLARIRLAVLEGGIYDYLQSIRSRKRSQKERLQALDSVALALEEWKSSLPSVLTDVNTLRTTNPELLPYLPILFGTSLQCSSLINKKHAMNIEWVNSLRDYSRNPGVLSIPSEWDKIIQEARDFIVMYQQWALTDPWNFWLTSCSCMTAMMLLTANNMHRRQHRMFSMDLGLVDEGLAMLRGVSEKTDCVSLQNLVCSCTEMHEKMQLEMRDAFLI